MNINRLFKKLRTLLEGYKWSLFITTFLFHETFVILLNYEVIKIPVVASDHFLYFSASSQIYNLLHTGLYTWGAIFPQHWYPLLLGILYIPFGGPSIILGTTINALLIAFSAVLFFKIINSFNNIDKKTAFWVSFFVMNGYASLMYNSSLLLKETWIVFLILSIFYLAIKMFKKEKFNWWLFIFILFLCIALRNLRFFIGFAMIVGFLAGWFLESKIILRKRIIYGVIMIFMFTFATFLLTGGGIGKSRSFLEYINPGFIYNLREGYFKNGSTTTNINVVEQSENVTSEDNNSSSQYHFSTSGVIKSSLINILGPFPWQLSFEKYIITFPDLIMLYACLFFGIIGIFKTKLKSSILYLIPTIIMFAGLVAGVDNLGALLRYRIPAVITISLFIPAGLYFVFKLKNNN